VPRVRHQLSVSRVIDGLDADDLCFQAAVLLAQEPQELQLCRRRPDHQDLVAVAKNGGDMPEEVGAVARVLVLGGWAFWVPVDMMFGRGDLLGLKLFCIDAENARFLMVQPNDGVVSVHALLESKGCAKSAKAEDLPGH
jgi:hypothetical protein